VGGGICRRTTEEWRGGYRHFEENEQTRPTNKAVFFSCSREAVNELVLCQTIPTKTNKARYFQVVERIYDVIKTNLSSQQQTTSNKNEAT
jgi:hypothetical protein